MSTRRPPSDTHRHRGAALAAALVSAAEAELPEQEKLRAEPVVRRSKLLDENDGATTERSSLPLAVRRLEQRIEAERRHVDRQMERLERRVEEVACGATGGGRWAELQGYVDGLAETVQDLVRRSEDGPEAGYEKSSGSTRLGIGREKGNGDSEAAASRVAALEKRVTQLEGPGSQLHEAIGLASEASEQTSELNSKMLQVGTRLMHVERGLDSLAALRDLPDQVATLASSVSREQRVSAQGATASELSETEIQHVLQGTCEQLGNQGARLQNVEQALEELGHLHEEVRRLGLHLSAGSQREPLASEDFTSVSFVGKPQDAAELQEQLRDACDQIDALRCELEEHTIMLQDQVADLGSKCQDLECGLQDVADAQETRQQVDHVGERALRLALRAQRAAHGQSIASNDARELREELSGVGEEIGNLWSRVEGAECGLESMATALGRICDELSSLRGASHRSPCGRTAAADRDAHQHETNGIRMPAAVQNRKPAERARLELQMDDDESRELRSKVEELERSLESMAEVVWDLRKQVSAFRSRTSGAAADGEIPSNGDSLEA
eukprot:TRINITY_DN18459_c0_g4_i1.p1 TRINITY_DN18459_c0_g4~~TRINITY_DN18459_c0_g4_i1.p1  ORF type:complete len:559 (+),score=127.35 TRINITY_DN18459_c0_g4_i1:90-1766(+)